MSHGKQEEDRAGVLAANSANGRECELATRAESDETPLSFAATTRSHKRTNRKISRERAQRRRVLAAGGAFRRGSRSDLRRGQRCRGHRRRREEVDSTPATQSTSLSAPTVSVHRARAAQATLATPGSNNSLSESRRAKWVGHSRATGPRNLRPY